MEETRTRSLIKLNNMLLSLCVVRPPSFFFIYSQHSSAQLRSWLGDERYKRLRLPLNFFIILKKLKKGETVPINITLPLKAFETEYKLSEKTIIFKRLPERENVTHFKPRSARAQSPKWWKIYNEVKHDVGVNIKEANLQTTRDALAGAFLLNSVHYPSVYRLYEHGVLKKITYEEVSNGTVNHYSWDAKLVKQIYVNIGTLPTTLETPLFIYDYAKKRLPTKSLKSVFGEEES